MLLLAEHRLCIEKPPPRIREGGFQDWKTATGIRTLDIHVGNRLASDQKRALRVSSGFHSMRLLQL